jgi:hypothetical protein
MSYDIYNLDGEKFRAPCYSKKVGETPTLVAVCLSNDDLVSLVFHKGQVDEVLEALGTTYPYVNETAKDLSRALHIQVYGTISPEFPIDIKHKEKD